MVWVPLFYARGGTRTRKPCRPGILSPLRIPIPPPGQYEFLIDLITLIDLRKIQNLKDKNFRFWGGHGGNRTHAIGVLQTPDFPLVYVAILTILPLKINYQSSVYLIHPYLLKYQ